MSTAIVTGGTGGLGVAVTTRLLDDGWDVVVPYNAPHELDRLAPHDRLALVEADLTDPDAVESIVGDAAEPLRALVNLVGGYAAAGRVHETPVEDFERQFALNLRPTYLCCAAALPRLLAADGGAIVCVSTRAVLRPFAGAAGYIASKAAVLGLVDALDAEYRMDGVRTNAILPSVIDTPANRAAQPDADQSRWVQPAEIAAVVAFLCSDDSAPVSGAHVPVYGRA